MLLYPKVSVIEQPIGTIVRSATSPGSDWVKCDGSYYAKADYSEYVSKTENLHPLRFQTWEAIQITNTGSIELNGVAMYGQYVVVVGNGQAHWYSSDYGETFTEYSSNLPSSADWTVIAHNGSYFVTAAYGSNKLAYSSDGITWNSVTLSTSGNWTQLEWNGDIWILAAQTGGTYFTSTNSTTWTQRSSLPSPYYSGLAKDTVNNEWLIVSEADSHSYHSTDGISWTDQGDFGAYFNENDGPYPPANIMYFADEDKWLGVFPSYSYGNDYSMCWQSFDDGETWENFHIEIDPYEQYGGFYGGCIYDGDCFIGLPYNMSYYRCVLTWTIDAGKFYRCKPQARSPNYIYPSGYCAEYEKCFITVGYYSTPTHQRDIVFRSPYTHYDCSTYFGVPHHSMEESNGVDKWIKLK